MQICRFGEWNTIANFHPMSSDHRPETRFIVTRDDRGILVCFTVADRYVRAVAQGRPKVDAYLDSCVEFFFKPRGERTYVNIEMTIAGAAHISHVRDWRRLPKGGLADAVFVESSDIVIETDHKGPIDPEIAEPVNWRASAFVPYGFMRRVWGDGCNMGEFLCNFYKCADNSSHPHWGSWAPIDEKLNFHRPECFGLLSGGQS